VWVGTRCIILPVINGAGSIATKDIPQYSLAAGNLAKVIKSLLH